MDIRIEFSHKLWWNTGELLDRASRLNMQVVTLQQHPVATYGDRLTPVISAWFFEDSQLMDDAKKPRCLLGGMTQQKLIMFYETGVLFALLKWVCLKIGNTPKPNGFADHYPY